MHRTRRGHALSDFFLEAGAIKLLPLAFGAEPFGIEEARKVSLLVFQLLLGQAQTVLGIIQRLLGLRSVCVARQAKETVQKLRETYLGLCSWEVA